MAKDSLTFRFGAHTYLAVRSGQHWHVTIEGNTKEWMYWLLSDDAVSRISGVGRLTD